MSEVRFELSIENPETETHYIISDISWSGAWAWDKIAPSIFALLDEIEPENLSNLDRLLKIIQGSAISDADLADLASRKCRSEWKPDHLARWFAVWTGVAPEDAIAALTASIDKIADSEQRVHFVMTFVTHLWGGSRGDGSNVRQAFKLPKYLKLLYLLAHENIHVSEDIERAGKGVYSPGLRDNAQNSRNSLFELLNQIPGKEAFLALIDIAKAHPEPSSRPWMMHHAKIKAEQDGDIRAWSAQQVRDFAEKFERTPSDHDELAELAGWRLLDLRDTLENGDSSIASILRNVSKETDIRKYLGHELREKAHGRYSIPQEEELADAKKPDLRFHGMHFDAPVPVELKLADNWTGPALFERLENQLCADYLRDNRSAKGIFVLVYRGEKAGWEIPGLDNRVDFNGLITALRNHWLKISPFFTNIDDIAVLGIDLTKRSK